MPRKKAKGFAAVGQRIKKARLDQKLSLEMVANETGNSVDFLKEVEAGRLMPPVGSLLQLARALNIDSAALLREPEESLKERIREYSKRTDNYAYETLTPGAENKHLKAFLVKVEAGREHSGVGYRHEGEEFVYVLSGTIEITVGEHVNHLNTGDSLHFNSGIQHNLKNTGDTDTELIVVIFTP